MQPASPPNSPSPLPLPSLSLNARKHALESVCVQSVTLDVLAWDDKEKIGQGTHRRAVVLTQPFLEACSLKKG